MQKRACLRPAVLCLGCAWAEHCAHQVVISSVSSSVPNPPGMVMKASASANIMALRVCISSTSRISPTVVPEICSPTVPQYHH